MRIKYQKVTGFWVYALITPDGMFYIGYSGKRYCSERWYKSNYKSTSLQPYIEKYGWENIRKVVLCYNLTEDQALLLEDLLIQEARKGGWCINDRRSGGNRQTEWRKERVELKREYDKQYRLIHTEEKRIKNKQRYDILMSTPEGKIYYRVKTFNKRHKDLKIETPLEAKQKYLQRGYIPDYIKNDDLI